MDLQPMMLVPIFYIVPLPETPSCPETYHEPAACEPSSSDSNSSWDDELYTMLYTTSETKNKWHMIERGLWLRANPLPLFGCFYKVEENGEYRHWGT